MTSPIVNVPYGKLLRQCGDFFPAVRREGQVLPPVLLIHGGGWTTLSKESMAPVARLLQSQGHHVFSINYRLIGDAPWPACGDDCLSAARFLLNGALAEQGRRITEGLGGAELLQQEKLILCGASAGGHLAMMTGIRLGVESVHAVVSLAGPSRLYPKNDRSNSAICKEGFLTQFFGVPTTVDDVRVRDASPVDCLHECPAPLYCIHSVNDQLVPLTHSQEAVAAWRQAGAEAALLTFDGVDEHHGFWNSENLETRELVSDVQKKIVQALEELSGDAGRYSHS